MSRTQPLPRISLLALLLVPAMAAYANDGMDTAPATDASTTSTAATLDQVQVIGKATSYAKTTVRQETLARQPVLGSVNGVLNESPGVVVTEGDPYGTSVWTTQINIRGFVTGRDTQQIGTTIDGLPNGGSSYGGGSLANRYIDTLDLETVEISQGTADISSRSNEALGGTLNFLTSDPLDAQRVRFVVGAGQHEASKYYVRYDTGLLNNHTRAWVSASSARNVDWSDGSGQAKSDHLAGKFVTELDRWTLSGYLSYNDAVEPEYGSVSLAQFASRPDQDNLVGTLTGIPYLDQNFRSGSAALRQNTFGYLRGAFDADNGFKATVTAYGHTMDGRGDWLPPYLVDVTADGAGNPESEYTGGSTVFGGGPLGNIYYVNPDLSAAQASAGCIGQAGIPAQYAPNCYPNGAAGAMSYRHTHYDNERYGLTADLEWTRAFGRIENTVRGGLWLEQFDRTVTRDWHRLLNVGTDISFDARPYWVQFADAYEADEQMYYIEDVMRMDRFTARLGLKQFVLDQSRNRVIGASGKVRSDTSSDPLFSAGFTYAPEAIQGGEFFAGFSQNFRAIPQGVLGGSNQAELARVEPETADNLELGFRLNQWPLTASVTLYNIKFDNRIEFLPANLVSGIDYLGQVDGVYENVGGVESHGVEAAFGYGWDNGWRVNAAYTWNQSEYVGSGDAARDAALGIAVGNAVMGQAEHILVASADWQGESVTAGISGRYLGARQINRANSAELPSVTVFNANIGFELADLSPRLKGVKAGLVISNLTDKRYLAGLDGENAAFIGAPRTASFQLTVDL